MSVTKQALRKIIREAINEELENDEVKAWRAEVEKSLMNSLEMLRKVKSADEYMYWNERFKQATDEIRRLSA